MVNVKVNHEKTLWQKHGKLFLTVFTGFLLAYGGKQYYEYYQTKQTLKASAVYDKMVSAMQKQDNAQIETEAKQLMAQFARTPYASLAALRLAKLAVEENNLAAAKDHLNFVLKNGDNDIIRQIAKIRLSRILADEKAYDAALTLLTKETVPESYKTLVEETKGDIYLMQNNKDKAREAYQAAISAAPPGIPVARLQLKQADLGVEEGL